MKYSIYIFFLFWVLIILNCTAIAELSDIYSMIGENDSIFVTDIEDRAVLSKNSNKPLIPASTLKILTSLASLHYLGKGYRFKTEFYIDKKNNLKIKGYGDPLLISEVILSICQKLSPAVSIHTQQVNNIILDSSYFEPLSIPGITSGSSEPYDAPNGALCANFNTVNFCIDADGNITSAEEQTPLLPFVLKRINSSGQKKGRIVLSENESILYPGYLFKHFLEKNGITTLGQVKSGRAGAKGDTLIYTHISPFSMDDLIAKLLEFSNNFIANQLFITMGTKVHGAPGSLKKGIDAVSHYGKSVLKLDNIVIAEGSGLSRSNRITSENMVKLLGFFEKHKKLMRIKNNEYYKTGTLSGISTRAGYFLINKRNLYRYSIILNSPGKSSERLAEKLVAELLRLDSNR